MDIYCKNFMPTWILGCMFLACHAGIAMAAGDKPPNIIIILTDDMGYADVGCYGAEGYKTPNLDRMASEGRRFTQWYASQPVCSA